MASVGDYVTAVLLAELAADDEVISSEVQFRRNTMLVDTFARRRSARQVLLAHMCDLLTPQEEDKKSKRAKTGQNDEVGDNDNNDNGVAKEPWKSGLIKTYSRHAWTTETRFKGNTEAAATATTTLQYFLYYDKEKFIEFQKHFGMKLKTFERIAQCIGPKLVNQEKFRQTVYVKILIGLWLLTTQASFRSISDKFHIQKSTTYYLFVQFVSIMASLTDDFIRWPSATDMTAIATEFHQNYGFPGVVGLVDSCQIPVKVSAIDATESTAKERAEPYSTVTFQAVCDHRMRFTNVHIGEPQTPHAVTCTWKSFESSSLGIGLAQHGLPNENHHLLGNSTYPLRTYLLTPYKEAGSDSGGGSTDNQHEVKVAMRNYFNVRHKHVRSLVHRALGILNRRFLRLKFINTQRYELVPQIIRAACVLHNIILDEDTDDEARSTDESSYVGSADVHDYKEEHVHPCPQADHHVPEDALIKRDSVAQQMLP